MKTVLLLSGAAFAIAAVTAVLVTPFIQRLATHVGMFDELSERRMHDAPRPRIGGIAVFLGFAFALFSTAGIAINLQRFGASETHALLGLLFGATLILCIGLWDDVMSMRARNKFVAQIAVASILMLYGSDFRIQGVGLGHNHWIDFPLWLSIPLSLAWYLGMMNAINFIDGLDGLLSGITAISGTALFVIALGKGHSVVAIVMVALVGAVIGFLPYNFNPARIILGDSGALFIGFIFAAASVIGDTKQTVTISLVLPLLVLALPILDTAATIVRRTRAGQRITQADRGHFHHQLVFRFGLDVRQAVLLIYVVCFVLGATAVVLSGAIGGPLSAARIF